MEEIACRKAGLRKEYLARRKRLGARPQRNLAIFQSLVSWEGYQKAPWVLLYLSTGEEVDTRRILEDALSRGKAVYAPVCRAGEEGQMDFYRVRFPGLLAPGAYGILEPPREEPMPAQVPPGALCLVPGLAFDQRGYRLGYGKGYYDRFLQKRQVRAVGLCYQALFVPSLPEGPFDQRVEAVITEQGCQRIPKRLF